MPPASLVPVRVTVIAALPAFSLTVNTSAANWNVPAVSSSSIVKRPMLGSPSTAPPVGAPSVVVFDREWDRPRRHPGPEGQRAGGGREVGARRGPPARTVAHRPAAAELHARAGDRDQRGARPLGAREAAAGVELDDAARL